MSEAYSAASRRVGLRGLVRVLVFVGIGIGGLVLGRAEADPEGGGGSAALVVAASLDSPEGAGQGARAVMQVTAKIPAAHTLGVSQQALVGVVVDQDLNQGSVTTSTLRVHGALTGRASGTISFPTNRSALLDPSAAFHPGEVIQVSATGGISSTTGNGLQPQVWSFWVATAAAPGRFHAPASGASFGGGGTSWDGVLGDIDGDGDLDAILTNYYNGPQLIWKNNGTGRFTAPAQGASFGAGYSNDIDLGDLDSDGDLDVVVANYAGMETVWLNDGAGVFSAPAQGASFGGGNSNALALGDLDGDGDLDAVVANSDGAETVWLNNGAGRLTAPTQGASFEAGAGTDIALGDLDSDGDLDALVTNGAGQAETVWLNDGTGRFSAPAQGASFEAGSSQAIALGDIDSDGDLDAVVANLFDEVQTVWKNNGAGVFAAPAQGASFGAGSSTDIALGDIDGDGDLDALVANASDQAETVWRNNGAGVFTAPTQGASFGAGGSQALALGDIDSDGDLDAVVVNYVEAATVWKNEEPLHLTTKSPAAHALDVAAQATVGVTVNQALNQASVTTSTLRVQSAMSGRYIGPSVSPSPIPPCSTPPPTLSLGR